MKMAYLSDIEIAQSCKMKPIGEIAAKVGVGDDYLEPYGRYKAKIDLSLLNDSKDKLKKVKDSIMSLGVYQILTTNEENFIENVEREISRASGKLSNNGFLEKAPKALVDAERAKRDKYLDMRDKISAQLKDLKG